MIVRVNLLTATEPFRTRPWINYTLALLLSLAGLALRMSSDAELAGFPFVTFFAP